MLLTPVKLLIGQHRIVMFFFVSTFCLIRLACLLPLLDCKPHLLSHACYPMPLQNLMVHRLNSKLYIIESRKCDISIAIILVSHVSQESISILLSITINLLIRLSFIDLLYLMNAIHKLIHQACPNLM